MKHIPHVLTDSLNGNKNVQFVKWTLYEFMKNDIRTRTTEILIRVQSVLFGRFGAQIVSFFKCLLSPVKCK